MITPYQGVITISVKLLHILQQLHMIITKLLRFIICDQIEYYVIQEVYEIKCADIRLMKYLLNYIEQHEHLFFTQP